MEKFLCLFLAALMMLTMLAACTRNDGDGGKEGETPAESSGNTSKEGTGGADEEPAQLNLDAKYVIIRPSDCSDEIKGAANALKDAISEALGESVSMKEDFLYGEEKPTQYEILLGQTNREESVKALENIKYNDYTVEIAGDKLVIAAYTDDKLIEAIEYVKGLCEKQSEGIVIKSEDLKTVRAEYKVDELKFGDTSLEGYTIVIPTKANGLTKSYAEKLQAKILELSGVKLPLVNDSKKEKEKEILLGNTAREESKAVKQAALPQNGYSITQSGSKIVVKSKDDGFTFVKTVVNMISAIEGGTFGASEGKLVLNNDPVFTAFCFTDVHNNFAMLEPDNSTGDYIVRKNVDGMIDHLLETEGAVDLVMVGGDLMSDYPDCDRSCKWPYKYFVEYRQRLVDTFSRLAKDKKTVVFTGGNHDYGQGEASTDAPHTPTGNYNSYEIGRAHV